MKTCASLAEISDQIKTSESDLRRTEAVKKLYPFADSDELYDKYGFTIQLLFDFVICSESPDLVIESLYFLLQIYQMPNPLLLDLTKKRQLLQKLTKALQSSVFEANILNLKSGLEIFGLLFMFISELAYFDAGLLTQELIGFVQGHAQSQNARLRAFAQFSLCGMLQFQAAFNRGLTAAVFAFLGTARDAQVLTALMQALACQSVREDFELCVPLDAFFEVLGGLGELESSNAQYSEQARLRGALQGELNFTGARAGGANSSVLALALADRIRNDALKFLVNVSTNERSLQRLCQPATVSQLLELYASCDGTGFGQGAASQMTGGLARSLTRRLTSELAGSETAPRRAVLYVLANISSTPRGAEAVRMTAGVEELLGGNLANKRYLLETLEIVAAVVYALADGAKSPRWPCASVFSALAALLKDLAKDCKDVGVDSKDGAYNRGVSDAAQHGSNAFLLQKAILIFNLALAQQSAVAAQIASSADIGAQLSQCDLPGSDVLLQRLEQ